jgi:hypothetical protein
MNMFILLNACEISILSVPIDESYLEFWVSLLGEEGVRVVGRELEFVSSGECIVMAGSKEIDSKPLILLQVNYRSMLTIILEF